jgi:hypothetical protein
MSTGIKLFVALAVLCLASASGAQEVQVSSTKGGIVVSVPAQQPYQLMAGESKTPTLSVECLHKGKKASHLLMFSPGGSMVDEGADAGTKGAQAFIIVLNGKKLVTPWVQYGDTGSYAYAGRTEPERLEFMHTVLNAGTVSFEFKPFLTGASTTSTFDVSKLRDAVHDQSACAE